MTIAAVSVKSHHDQGALHGSLFMSVFCYCIGVYSGSLWQEAAASDWVRDLLCSLRDPYCSSQTAGTTHNTNLPEEHSKSFSISPLVPAGPPV